MEIVNKNPIKEPNKTQQIIVMKILACKIAMNPIVMSPIAETPMPNHRVHQLS